MAKKIKKEQPKPKTYEMLWDCKRCGTKKLLGVTHRYCPNCGGIQNPEDRYFPEDNEKVEAKNHVYYGVDVICFHCNCANSRKNNNCTACGASLKDGDDKDAALISESLPVLEKNDENKVRAFFRKYKSIAVIAALITGIAIWVSLNTKVVSADISNYLWNTTVKVEVFKTVNDGAWEGSVPSDAYHKSCYSKHHHDDKVVSGSHEECSTHKVDNGDGSFREEESCKTVNDYESVPVYKTYCDFQVDRWVFFNDRRLAGPRTQDIKYDALPTSETCVGNIFGCKREAGRSLYYSATVKTSESAEDKDIETCHIDKSLYDLQPGVVNVKTVFNDIQCGSISLKPDAPNAKAW